MNRRSMIVSATVVTCLGLTASGAGAATSPAPAAGNARSTVSLLTLEAGGHSLRLGDVSLVADTRDGVVSAVVLTPVTADGTAYGERTVTPASSPLSLAAVSSPGALAEFGALTSPEFSVSASSAPSTQVGTTSLGSLSLLGLPVPFSGGVSVGSAVGPSVGALASKSVTLKNLSLPSIAAILGALGLDVRTLPVGTLTALLDQLDLITGAVTTAQAAVDTAQSAVDTATADLATRTAGLSAAQASLATAQDTFTAATTTLQASLADAAFGGTISDYAALPQLTKDALALLAPSLPASYTAYTAAETAVAAAQSAVTAAQGLVDTAQAQLTALLDTLRVALGTLLDAAVGVLDATPLLRLASLELSTVAQARTAAKDGQSARVVGGTLTGLQVLGTDVLQAALNTSTVDLSALGATAAATLNSTIAGLTGTLSSVLSSVPGFPALDVPAPQVALLTKSAATSVSGGFGRAETSITGLGITLPAVTVPLALALPGAADLPAFAGVTQGSGVLVTAPVRLGLLTLRDQASFRPATVTVSTPTAGTPPGATPPAGKTLADTGLPSGVALLALTVLTAGLAMRRRLLSLG